MLRKNSIFVGLDIETTASTLDGALVEIGVAFKTTQGWERFQAYARPHEGALIQPKAMEVNGLDLDRLRNAPELWLVDETLFGWLTANALPDVQFVPIGFNVAGFDMQFVRKYLPKTAQLFSYRSVDLNAILYTLDTPQLHFEALKRRMKRAAERELARDLGPEPRWHSADYDAMAAYAIWQILMAAVDRPEVTAYFLVTRANDGLNS